VIENTIKKEDLIDYIIMNIEANNEISMGKSWDMATSEGLSEKEAMMLFFENTTSIACQEAMNSLLNEMLYRFCDWDRLGRKFEKEGNPNR